jgi:hypothetical protein
MNQVIAEAGMAKVIDIPAPQCKRTEVLVSSEFSRKSTGGMDAEYYLEELVT